MTGSDSKNDTLKKIATPRFSVLRNDFTGIRSAIRRATCAQTMAVR